MIKLDSVCQSVDVDADGANYTGSTGNPGCNNTKHCEGCKQYRNCMQPCDTQEAMDCKMKCHDPNSPGCNETCLPYYHCVHGGKPACPDNIFALCDKECEKGRETSSCLACMDINGHCDPELCKQPEAAGCNDCTWETFRRNMSGRNESTGFGFINAIRGHDVEGPLDSVVEMDDMHRQDNFIRKCKGDNCTANGYEHCELCSSDKAESCMTKCRCGPSAGYIYPEGKPSLNPSCDGPFCEHCEHYRSCMKPCDARPAACSCLESGMCAFTTMEDMELLAKRCQPFAHCRSRGGHACIMSEYAKCVNKDDEDEDKDGTLQKDTAVEVEELNKKMLCRDVWRLLMEDCVTRSRQRITGIRARE